MLMLLALLFAARVGGAGLRIVPPADWTVIATHDAAGHVALLRKGDSSIRVIRTTPPIELQRWSSRRRSISTADGDAATVFKNVVLRVLQLAPF